MPAVSKAQQRFMGMVRAYQKGDLQHPSKKMKEVGNSMSMKTVRDFAATKHKDLPEYMKQADCALHDPNVPESFDGRQRPIEIKKKKEQQKKAFVRGFMKAALSSDLAPEVWLEKLSNDVPSPASPDIVKALTELGNQSAISSASQNFLLGTGIGGAGGAGIGAGLGYLTSKDPEIQKRRAVLGALLGTGLGGFAGASASQSLPVHLADLNGAM